MDLRKCPKCGHRWLRWNDTLQLWECCSLARAGADGMCSYSAPHEIVEGSCWRRKAGGKLVLVCQGHPETTIYPDGVWVVGVDRWDAEYDTFETSADFRDAVTFVDDPGEK